MAAVSEQPRRNPLARALSWPLRRALDERVMWTSDRAAELVANDTSEKLEAQTTQLAGRIDELRRSVSEVLDHGRAVEERVDRNERELLRALGALHAAVGAGDARKLDDLTAPAVQFLSWSA